MCTWRVFALIRSPVPQQLASFPGLKIDYSAVVLDRSLARFAFSYVLGLLSLCSAVSTACWERCHIRFYVSL